MIHDTNSKLDILNIRERFVLKYISGNVPTQICIPLVIFKFVFVSGIITWKLLLIV